MRALIVEDDPGIARGLRFALTQAGYATDVSDTLASAWLLLLSESFDVVVLDLGLPDGDGASLLARLRQRPAHDQQAGTHALTPVLIMTARDEVPDRIAGLDLGADDYLVKPFDVHELLARLRAIQRRAAGRAAPLLVHGELALDPAARKVSWRGQEVALGVREFDLLHTLLQVSPRVLSKGQLEASLYSLGEGLESNAIEVHVHHLRRKIHERLIQTVRGVGYCIPPESPA
jgi:two-component system, OmpR family, response regulator QseB